MKSKKFSEIFSQVAIPEMNFLTENHSFIRTKIHLPTDETLVSTTCGVVYSKKYKKSEYLFITLSLTPFRLESYIDFARGENSTDNSFTIYELYEVVNGGVLPPRIVNLYEAAFNPIKMRIEIDRLIKLFITCGQRFLENDDSLWLEIAALRKQKHEEEKYNQASTKAEAAFKIKNWEETIKLLNSLGNKMTKLQQARLNYAIKKSKHDKY